MNQITFEYSGVEYVVDGEAYFLDHIVLPNGILLKVEWEDLAPPAVKTLDEEKIPVTMAGATNEELAEEYRAVIAEEK